MSKETIATGLAQSKEAYFTVLRNSVLGDLDKLKIEDAFKFADQAFNAGYLAGLLMARIEKQQAQEPTISQRIE
jgi:hypothetical protein